jgi:hypothetical protein
MGLGPATSTDLSNRSLTTLTSSQLAVGTVKLDDAYVQIITAIPSVVTRLAALPLDTVFQALVVQVQCAAVLRYLQNPEGKYQEAGDDYSFTRDKALSTGETYITDDELALLVSTSGSPNAFTVKPASSGPDAFDTTDFGYWS